MSIKTSILVIAIKINKKTEKLDLTCHPSVCSRSPGWSAIPRSRLDPVRRISLPDPPAGTASAAAARSPCEPSAWPKPDVTNRRQDERRCCASALRSRVSALTPRKTRQICKVDENMFWGSTLETLTCIRIVYPRIRLFSNTESWKITCFEK